MTTYTIRSTDKTGMTVRYTEESKAAAARFAREESLGGFCDRVEIDDKDGDTIAVYRSGKKVRAAK